MGKILQYNEFYTQGNWCKNHVQSLIHYTPIHLHVYINNNYSNVYQLKLYLPILYKL